MLLINHNEPNLSNSMLKTKYSQKILPYLKQIQKISYMKFVGVYFDCNLTWNIHLNNKAKQFSIWDRAYAIYTRRNTKYLKIKRPISSKRKLFLIGLLYMSYNNNAAWCLFKNMKLSGIKYVLAHNCG